MFSQARTTMVFLIGVLIGLLTAPSSGRRIRQNLIQKGAILLGMPPRPEELREAIKDIEQEIKVLEFEKERLERLLERPIEEL
ncbi:MAG: YtxH domain-containing protein [Chloroflexi bacterium]|nr:YtxH domain-containing protein [Chloroflexota bacterium]MCL5075687.1 YtxH domain-containing protein [Chloroflexota bacterium]